MTAKILSGGALKILTCCLWRSQAITLSGLLVFVLACTGSLFAQATPDWTEPFIDADGYKKYIAQKEQDFRTELAKQKAAVYEDVRPR